MKIKGVTVQKSKYLGWREGNSLTDIDDNGKPVQNNYIVLVSKKDCPKVLGENGKMCYNPENAKQSVILSYGGTYYGYGKRRSNLYKNYDTISFYAVYDNYVYTGTIRQYPKFLAESEQPNE